MLFVHQSRIDKPVERVFAFHERPDALAKLVPPWQKVEIVQPPSSLAPGTRVVLKMKLGPFWRTWVAEHTFYEPGVLFQDVMRAGPFKRWVHTHRFLRDDGRTLLRDEIDFEAPLGLSLLFVPSLRRAFAFRHAVTAREC